MNYALAITRIVQHPINNSIQRITLLQDFLADDGPLCGGNVPSRVDRKDLTSLIDVPGGESGEIPRGDTAGGGTDDLLLLIKVRKLLGFDGRIRMEA